MDGRTDGRTDDGRTPEHGHPISSPCEPNGSGELIKYLGHFQTKREISKYLGHFQVRDIFEYLGHFQT